MTVPRHRADHNVAGIVDSGVHARIGDDSGRGVQRHRDDRQTAPDAGRKRERRSRVPRRERQRGRHPDPTRHRLLRQTFRPRPAPDPLDRHVDDSTSHRDRAEALRGGPPARACPDECQHARHPYPHARVVGSVRQRSHPSVQRGRRGARDRGVHGPGPTFLASANLAREDGRCRSASSPDSDSVISAAPVAQRTGPITATAARPLTTNRTASAASRNPRISICFLTVAVLVDSLAVPAGRHRPRWVTRMVRPR